MPLPGDGHAIDKCEECSVNLKSKYSCKNIAEQISLSLSLSLSSPCDHRECKFLSRSRRSRLSHGTDAPAAAAINAASVKEAQCLCLFVRVFDS